MPKIIDARFYVGAGRPESNGARLAEIVMQLGDIPWIDLVIDARGCPADFLNSALFNAFWQKLYEAQPQRLEEAKGICWEFMYPFQKANFEFLRAHFQPHEPA